MNEFDFLSRVPIGQYFNTGSILHRLDPRTKIVMFFLLIAVITFSTSLIGLGSGVVLIIGGILLSKVKLGYAMKGLLPALPFLVIIALFQVVLFSTTTDPVQLVNIGFIRITLTGIMAGVLLLARFSALILTISLASFCISTSEMIQGLQKLLNPLNKLKIKTMDLVMVIQVMLRFIPFLIQTAERIAKAQASRGADWGGKTRNLFTRIRQVIPLIIPLFLISLRRSENLALAMDARAYGYLQHRTSMMEMRFSKLDAFAALITIIASLAILFA